MRGNEMVYALDQAGAMVPVGPGIMQGRAGAYGVPMDKLTFFYSSGNSAAMAASGATTTLPINILADADFLSEYITITVLQAGLVVLAFGGSIQITDSAAGRTLFNIPIGINNILGDGSLPYPLKPARLWARNSTVTIDLTSNVATSTTVEVVFHGTKLFQ